LILPCGFIVLIFLENVRVFARIPISAMRAIFLDEIGALAEPWIIFRVMSARLGDILSERKIHFIAHRFGVIDLGAISDCFVNEWIRILAVPFVFEIPCLMKVILVIKSPLYNTFAKIGERK